MPQPRPLVKTLRDRAAALALLIVLPLAASAGPRMSPPPPPFVPVPNAIRVVAVLPTDKSHALSQPLAPAGDTTLLSQAASAASVAPGGTLHYTVSVTNATTATQTFRITDTLPAEVSYLNGTASGGFMYNAASTSLTATRTLSAFHGDVVTAPGAPPYVEISGTQSAQNVCLLLSPCDNRAVTLGLPMAFRYLGVDYTEITLDSNGFVIPGSADPGPGNENQHLPDPAAPNGVIAPFWDDLHLRDLGSLDPSGGSWWYAVLEDNNFEYLVIEWRDAQNKSIGGTSYSFQVWVQLQAEHITFAYEDLTGNSTATIGFENSDGTLGHSYHYDSTGPVPAADTELQIVADYATAQLGYDVQAHADLKGCSSFTNPIRLTNGPGNRAATDNTLTDVFGPCAFLPLIRR